MATNKDFHVSISSPDNTVFRSFKLSEFVSGNVDPSKIKLSVVRAKCQISSKFQFSADGKTALGSDYDIAYYVSITPENHAKVFGNSPKAATGETMKPGEAAGASAAVGPSTAVQESGGPEGHSGVQESGGPEEDSGVRESEEPLISGAPPANATSSTTTAPSSNIPIPTIIITLVLSTMHPTQNVPIGDLADKLRSLASTAKDDLTVRNLASLADSMPKLAALTTNFAANPSSINTPEPADLTSDKWAAVLFNTNAMNGFSVGPGGFAKSTYPGFSPLFTSSNGLFSSTSGFPYPHFELHDDSSVTVTELQTAMQKSLAQQSFSSKTVEASVSGSGFGISASASTSYDKGEAAASLAKTTTTADSMHVSYNFPRVILYLRPDSLSLDLNCAKDAYNVKNEADKDAFYEKYGTWFASQVTLGGRLHSTTTLTDSEKQNVVDTKKTLRVAASVSFGSPWVSASASYAQTDNSAQNTDRNSMVKNMTLTWDAHGGDTLLCSNPPAWAETVKDYRLWRVMDQTNIVSLSSILKQIDPSVPEILTKPPLTPTPSSGAPVLGKVVLLDFGNEPLQTVWDKVAKDDPLTVDRPKLSYERDSYDFDNLHVQELKLDLPTTDLAGGSSKKGWNILNPQQKYNVVRAFYNSAITHFGI